MKTRTLILNIVMAAEVKTLSIQDIISVCELFDVKANSVRVNVQRLTSDRLLSCVHRGLYQLGPAAKLMANQLSEWRNALQRIVPWRGDWLGVHCGSLGRTDRKALKNRERALFLNGFKELDRSLYIRPNNLIGGLDTVKIRLESMGLENGAIHLKISDFEPAVKSGIPGLWNFSDLNSGYTKSTTTLQNWLNQYESLEIQEAARQSFMLGNEAIKQMIYDPLLPEEWINGTARQAFIEILKEFDNTGHSIWRTVLENAEVTT